MQKAKLSKKESERELQKQEGVAEVYCIKADCRFFGVGGEPQNTSEAIELYEKSAARGNSKAMMVLGRIYENGIHVKQNLDKAFQYYRYAWDTNQEPYAMYKIGMFLEEGNHPEPECVNGKPNREFAYQYFKEALNIGDLDAENAFKEAFFKIGQYHQFGYGGVAKNINYAISMYDKAACDGHIESMNALGSLYFNEHPP